MSDIKIFEHEVFGRVRVVEKEGEPWFVAVDVAKALEYRMASDMTRILDDDEKGTQKVSTLGGVQEVSVINEAGVYVAVIKSNKKEAKKFKRWVTHEVLPSIRKTGSYSVLGGVAVPNFSDPVEAARAWADAYEKKRNAENALEEAKPKIEVYDTIVEKNHLYNASQVAQKLGKSAVWLNKQLESFEVYNKNVKRSRAFRQWFVDEGYGLMRETNNGFSQCMFTAAGEIWAVQKLTEEGIIG